ncbi:MAG: hypothetical protein LBK82_09450 [Planctomycetaceae bacterium]|nr:hypothetical protein [Planctomycetaceae bacterium]
MGNLSLKGCVGKADFASVNGGQFDSKMVGNPICRCESNSLSASTPTQPFSERLPTSFHLFSCVSRLKRTFQCLDT